MTALAWSLTPSRVALGADTLLTAPALSGGLPRPAGFRTKLLLLPDLRMALACRGVAADIGFSVYVTLLQNWMIDTADQAFEQLPGLFRAETDAYAREVTGWPAGLDQVLCVFLAFGWSAAAGRFVGSYGMNCQFGETYPGDYAPITIGDGFDMAPSLPPDEIARLVEGPAAEGVEPKLVRLIADQKRRHDDTGIGGIGGRVDVVTLDRTETRQRTAHRFSDAAEAEEAAAARFRATYDHQRELAALQGAMAPVDIIAREQEFVARGAYSAAMQQL